MRSCNITNSGCESLAEGLSRNYTLTYLDISSNKFTGRSLSRWGDILGKTKLKHLDMSNNRLDDEGLIIVVLNAILSITYLIFNLKSS